MGARRRRLDRNMNLITSLYPGVHTVYGPYLSKDDPRYRVVLYDGKKRITRQYAKLKMEIHLERRLHPHNETVDHFDGNKRNDSFSNLRVLPRGKHQSEDALRLVEANGKCKICGTIFALTKKQRQPSSQKKAGPFCSRTCTGKYGFSRSTDGSVIKRTKHKATYSKRKTR